MTLTQLSKLITKRQGEKRRGTRVNLSITQVRDVVEDVVWLCANDLGACCALYGAIASKLRSNLSARRKAAKTRNEKP